MRIGAAVVGVVTACGFSGSGAPDANVLRRPDAAPGPDGPPSGWVLVETLVVPADGLVVTSMNPLAAGVGYRLRASGTFTIQSEVGTESDAEFWNFAAVTDGVGTVDVGLAVDDTVEDLMKNPKWGPYSPSHVYEVPWTGAGTTITAQIHDGNHANNLGWLTLEILGSP